MNTKSFGILMTTIASFLFGIPGLILILTGSLVLAGKGGYRMEIFGGIGRQAIDPLWGLAILAVGLLMLAFPIAGGILTRRARV